LQGRGLAANLNPLGKIRTTTFEAPWQELVSVKKLSLSNIGRIVEIVPLGINSALLPSFTGQHK